jgi:branched-chain amino acid transport system substrate-binding protein
MNGLTPYFYDGTNMLFKAIQEAGTIDNTDAIKNKLLNIKDYPGLLGKINWTGEKVYGINRQIVTPSYVGQVQDGKEKVLAKLE